MKRLHAILSCFTAFIIVWMLGNPVQVHAYGITAIDDALIHQDSSGIKGGAEINDNFGHAVASGDFDADGDDDLAIGIPWEDIVKNTIDNAGAVQVILGSPSGITKADRFYADITPQGGELFGYALAAGDFNHDGASDLAIGVPRKRLSVGSTNGSAGQVTIIYGLQDHGLDKSHHQFLSQGGDYRDQPEQGDWFGRVLASGDFDGDKFIDLAVGIPFEGVSDNTVYHAGVVQVFYGSEQGFTERDQLFKIGDPQEDDNYGATLAAGDFNGDGYSDLAIGAPGRDVNGADGSGAVFILYGEKLKGLSTTSAQFVSQYGKKIPGVPEPGDGFGSSLAAGDFNGDGYSELAVGVPKEDIKSNSIEDGGMVQVFNGSSEGLNLGSNKVLSQGTPTEGSDREAFDLFGYSLVTGNFNGDEFDDLAVGVPGEDIVNNTITSGGAVQVFYGSANSVTTSDELWGQSSPGIQGKPEPHDQFGLVLASGDFNEDNVSDLVVGVPNEEVNGKLWAGAVHILEGGDPVWRLTFDNKLAVEDSIIGDLEIAINLQGGYQFGLFQSGKPVLWSANGMVWPGGFATNNGPNNTIDMETNMKMNIGSVSKMILTITALKMADYGLFDLTDPIGPFLARHPSSVVVGTAVDPTVANISIYELLTHASHFASANNWPFALSSPRNQAGCSLIDTDGDGVGDTVPPYTTEGAATPCSWQYQNMNAIILRYVIESAAGLFADPNSHPAALVQYIQVLWLNEVGVGDMSCDPNPEMTYYPNNVNYVNPSRFCSSGGWRASAEDWLRILRFLSYGQILSDERTERLFSITLSDWPMTAGGSAMGWEPITWQNGGQAPGVLRKDGGINGVLTTCVGHYPQGVDMVLLVNDDLSGGIYACRVLRDAWLSINFDRDGDGVPDFLDAFPYDPSETVDTDGDGTGDNADTDDDNDGVRDRKDDFSLDPKEWVDTDGDGIGDNHDRDDDDDGIPDDEETGGRKRYKTG